MQPLPTMHGKIRWSDILDSVHATLLYSHVTLIASAASSNDNACISCIIYLEKKKKKKPRKQKNNEEKGSRDWHILLCNKCYTTFDVTIIGLTFS